MTIIDTRMPAYFHPDALYDQPYECFELDLSDYRELGSGASLLIQDSKGILLGIGSARLRVDVWGKGTLRLRVDPQDTPSSTTTELLGLIKQPSPEPVRFSVNEQADAITLTTDLLTLGLDTTTGDLTLTDAQGHILWQTVEGGLRFSDESGEYSGKRFCCWSELGDQHCYGFGGRIAPLDRTGQSVDVFSMKTGVRPGDYGGFPVPFFISTRGYGLFLNNPWPHVYFDMGKIREDRWLMHAPGGQCDLFLFAGPNFPDVIGRYTQVTGRVPAVPKWMLGFWCSSLSMTTADAALADAKRMREEGYPCDAFVFDGPWRGGPDFAAKYVTGKQYPSEDLDWHRDFGDGAAMTRDLGQLGIKTILHLNSRSFSGKTADEGVAKGLLRRIGEEVVPRLLDDAGEVYYQSMLLPRVDEGVAAWWTDHSDRVSGELAPGLPSRNLFGVLWNRLLAHMMQPSGAANCPALSRGGGIGSQRYAIPWPGDTRCGIDALAEDIWFMVSAGLCGFALTSADLAGFEARRGPEDADLTSDELHARMFDDENLCRRLCHCLLWMPVPRIHNNCDTIPKFPWNCSPKVQQLYHETLEERYRFTPYLYSYILDASLTGLPLLRPMVYEYPRDEDAIDATTQFMIGDCLLAAPVTEAGHQTRDVYLPEGVWFDWWTGDRYEGPTHVQVDAPMYALSGLPLFARAGAIICNQDPTIQLNDEPPQRLWLQVYAEGQSEITLRETPQVANRFVLDTTTDGLVMDLENNCDFDRQYVIHVRNKSREPISIDMPAGSKRRVNL